MNILQVQFVIVMIHSFQLFFIDCNYPKLCAWAIGLQAVIFHLLFADFYKQAYKKKQASKVRIGILVLYVNIAWLFNLLFHSSVTQTELCTLSCHCCYPAPLCTAADSGYKLQDVLTLKY